MLLSLHNYKPNSIRVKENENEKATLHNGLIKIKEIIIKV